MTWSAPVFHQSHPECVTLLTLFIPGSVTLHISSSQPSSALLSTEQPDENERTLNTWYPWYPVLDKNKQTKNPQTSDGCLASNMALIYLGQIRSKASPPSWTGKDKPRVHSVLRLGSWLSQEDYAKRMRSANTSDSTLPLEKVLKFMSSYSSRNEERKASRNTLQSLKDTLLAGHMRFVELLCVTWKWISDWNSRKQKWPFCPLKKGIIVHQFKI